MCLWRFQLVSKLYFSRYLEQQTGIRFREKAKQFLPEFDESNKMLIVILDEEHLKSLEMDLTRRVGIISETRKSLI